MNDVQEGPRECLYKGYFWNHICNVYIRVTEWGKVQLVLHTNLTLSISRIFASKSFWNWGTIHCNRQVKVEGT